MNQEPQLAEHLEELRKRLIYSIASVVILSGVGFFLSDAFLYFMTLPIHEHVSTLYFFTPYEALLTKLKIAFVSGIVLSLPVLFTQLWGFIAPGLYEGEQKLVLPFALAGFVLFLVGALFAYFWVIPFALRFFLGFSSANLTPLISIGAYSSFFLSLLLTFGLAFDFPVLLVALMVARVLSAEALRQGRRWILVLLVVASAILTPTTDPISMCLLAVPLWGLFEAALWIGSHLTRGKA